MKTLKKINLIIVIAIIINIVVSEMFFAASPFQIGEFIGKTAIITVGVWFLTLLIPKRFKAYSVLSSGTFILCVPLVLSLHFLIQHILSSNDLHEAKRELLSTIEGNEPRKSIDDNTTNDPQIIFLKKFTSVISKFNSKYQKKTINNNELYIQSLKNLTNSLNKQTILTQNGKQEIMNYLQDFKKVEVVK